MSGAERDPEGEEEHLDPERDSGLSSSEDEDELRSLLRDALRAPAEESPDLLGGVQKKLRQRSGGKFYADGWSTAREEPLVFYLYTSVFMLAAVVLLYLALSTSAGVPVDVINEPAPIQLVPPPR